MNIKPGQLKLVRDSFAKIVPIADDAAGTFYARLFEVDPQLQQMFKGDMKVQGRKLMNMMVAVVRCLDDAGKLLPLVRKLGVGHAANGVREKDYNTVGIALLWTLEKLLGDAFTPAVMNAWAAVYGGLAATMKDAALENEMMGCRRTGAAG